MSKEKQIDEMARSLNEATFGVNVHTLADHLHPETIHKVAEYLYNAGYRKQGEWISVDERLPEQCVPVLVYKNRNSEAYGNMETAYFEKGRWRGSCGEFITHWMPLPKAPKMERGEQK